MTLYEKLQKASSEEDVKDAYIKALGLKEVQKEKKRKRGFCTRIVQTF